MKYGKVSKKAISNYELNSLNVFHTYKKSNPP